MLYHIISCCIVSYYIMFIVSYHIIVLQYIIASFYSALLYYITLYIILYVYTACIYVYNIYLQISLEVSLAGLSYWDTLGPSSWGRNQKLLPLDSMREWSPVKLGLSWTLAWPSPSTSVIHWSGDHGVFRKKLFQFGVIWFLALDVFLHMVLDKYLCYLVALNVETSCGWDSMSLDRKNCRHWRHSQLFCEGRDTKQWTSPSSSS